jgi:transketolase
MHYKIGEKVALRKAFGEQFYEYAKKRPNIIALSSDFGSSMTLNRFWEEFPDRFFNPGVAEQNMIGIASGLAIRGFIPFAGASACFFGRAMDHVRQSIAQNKVNVKVVGTHGGVSNAMDGPSAHAIEDLAFFRAIPNFAVVVVSDPNQMYKAIKETAEYPTPVYLRLYREPLPVFLDYNTPFKIGKANILRKGRDISVIACGVHVGFCLEIAQELEKEGIDLEIIDNHSLFPFDKQTIFKSAKKTGAVVTVEDHNVNGGLGSAVAEVLGENLPTPMIRVGLRDFATTGDYFSVINAAGIGKEGIKEAIYALLNSGQ